MCKYHGNTQEGNTGKYNTLGRGRVVLFMILGKLSQNDPNEVITVKDLQIKFMVSPTTAKSDLVGLINRGLIDEFSFNRVKKGYRRSQEFDAAVEPFLRS